MRVGIAARNQPSSEKNIVESFGRAVQVQREVTVVHIAQSFFLECLVLIFDFFGNVYRRLSANSNNDCNNRHVDNKISIQGIQGTTVLSHINRSIDQKKDRIRYSMQRFLATKTNLQRYTKQ